MKSASQVQGIPDAESAQLMLGGLVGHSLEAEYLEDITLVF